MSTRDGINWYVYCNNNPINYTDPDGRIQVDATGGYYLYANSEEVRKGNSGKISSFQDGYVLANNGDKIEARYNSNRSIKGENFDCHGFTFTNGTFWIKDNQVEKVLKGDGYKKVDTPRILLKTIMIQRDKETNDIIHSGNVVGFDKEKGIVTVEEAMGTVEFKTSDGGKSKTRIVEYKLSDHVFKFYTVPPNKVIENE